jgi:hypothetical protein
MSEVNTLYVTDAEIRERRHGHSDDQAGHRETRSN